MGLISRLFGSSTDEEENTEEIQQDESVAMEQREEVLSQNVPEVKEYLQDQEHVNWSAYLEAERENKDRTTLTDWLERRTED